MKKFSVFENLALLIILFSTSVFGDTRAMVERQAGKELDANYSIHLKVTENADVPLDLTVVTASDHFESSAITKDSKTITFTGNVKVKKGKGVLLVYLLGIRQQLPETKEYVDTGTTGTTLFRFGEPVMVFSAGGRSYQVTVNKEGAEA